MDNIIIELSKYFMIILMAFYTLHGFIVFRYSDEADRRSFYIGQNLFMIFIHFTGYVVMTLYTDDRSIMFFYAFQELLFVAVLILYKVIYPLSNRLILNNMLMLLSVSFIILARLSFDKCLKQYTIVIISLVFSLVIPVLVRYTRSIFMHFTWIYGFIGIAVLLTVLILGSVTNGSKLSFTLHGITFQPSEVIKILFVFFVAAMLSKSSSFIQIVITTVFAAVHVGILALSKDLGSALIFFVVYVMMLYVASENFLYLFLGTFSGVGAGVLGYKLFSHVRTRFLAWRDPFSYIDDQGYQITQSLFAIGTGGWFGMGLYQGSPKKITIVEADFIFAAISEEMGCFFSLCIILVCISNFLMFMNISMKMRDKFFRLVSLGFSVIYGFQMFLTIGGVTKFIPLTGVTLPLVSYGGTSVLTTVVMFSIIQGIYILRYDSFDEMIESESINNGAIKAKKKIALKNTEDDDFEYL